jgi:hypothetical protein
MDYFGRAIAFSGTTLVVGASYDDTAGTDVGAAYVYDLARATPTVPVRILNPPSPALGDQFGFSVAVSGTRMVAGAPKEDTGATDSGSAYVYDLASATPSNPVFTLNNPTPATGDLFGSSVAISGNWAVVGAGSDDTGVSNAGSAYIYDLASATPAVPKYTLNNPTPASGDGFGGHVAISGSRVVVGASSDNTGATDAGSAYVYELSGSTPTIPKYTLNNPNPDAGDGFGSAVAISGSRVVVGANQDDVGATNAGSVYVYDLDHGTPTVPIAELNNPHPTVVQNLVFL